MTVKISASDEILSLENHNYRILISNYFSQDAFFLFIFFDLLTQVGFAEFNNTADNRANIGGTIIGAPIVGQ